MLFLGNEHLLLKVNNEVLEHKGGQVSDRLAIFLRVPNIGTI